MLYKVKFYSKTKPSATNLVTEGYVLLAPHNGSISQLLEPFHLINKNKAVPVEPPIRLVMTSSISPTR